MSSSKSRGKDTKLLDLELTTNNTYIQHTSDMIEVATNGTKDFGAAKPLVDADPW